MRIHHKETERPETLRTLALRHRDRGLDRLEQNQVVYEPVDVKTILTRNPNPGLHFHWSINPYRGCQFGCTYCFARYTATFVEVNDPLEFERRIFYKRNAPELVRHLRDSDFYGKPVALGTATDPWQPAEARFRITRGILEGLRRYPSLDLSCLTKSALIRRDEDLFREIVASGRPVSVGFSITTLDADLSKKMEPQAALPRERLKSMRILADAGVTVGLMAMPVVPHLTDSEEDLDALLGAARDHGAQYVIGGALHLRKDPKKRFLPWVEAEFPHLARDFHGIYDYGPYHTEDYRQAVRDRIERLRIKHGYPAYRPGRPTRKGEQLGLW